MFGLLDPDPDTEIGHFAFSRLYWEGLRLDKELREEIREFETRRPGETHARSVERDLLFKGAVESYKRSSEKEKVHDLIVIGATHAVWPTGTSFVLTYPWDLAGRGRPAAFKSDLSEFTRRRIIDMLKDAGKYGKPGPSGLK